MNRVKSFVNNPDMLRCVFLFLTIFILFSMIDDYVRPYIRYVILPWGAYLVIKDLLGKRLLFKVKYIWLLVALLVLFGITMLLNLEHFNNNFYMLAFSCIYFLVLYPPDYQDKPNETNSKEKKCRAIFIFCIIFIVPATILSALSLWSYLADFYVAAQDGTYFGYAGYMRLQGFFANPNITGVVSLLSIAMLTIVWVTLCFVFNKQHVVKACKIFTVVLLLLHLTTLTLSDSRASRLALLAFVLLFSCAAFLRYFSGKFKSIAWGALAAVLVSVMVTTATYCIDQPIRIGAAMVQAAVREKNSEVSVNSDNTSFSSNALPVISIIGIPEVLPAESDDAADELVVTGRNAGWVIDAARRAYWELGFEVIKQNPLFGVSPDALYDEVISINASRPEETRLTDREIESIGGGLHNAYIELAASNGIPALLVFILFLILFTIRNLKLLLRNLRSDTYLTVSALFVLCAAILFWNMFESWLFDYHYYTTVIFWSCLSFSASLLQDNLNNAAENDKIQDIKA